MLVDFEDFEERLLVRLAQRLFEFGRVVEVVLKRGFPARGDEDEFGDARRAGFVDGVLDQRPVDEGHDLFRDGLRCGKKPRAQTCDGKYRLGDPVTHSNPTPKTLYLTSAPARQRQGSPMPCAGCCRFIYRICVRNVAPAGVLCSPMRAHSVRVLSTKPGTCTIELILSDRPNCPPVWVQYPSEWNPVWW